MKKLYISADIEGTCGILSWNETIKSHPDYPAFARQMTREVAAACEGAHEAGYDEILVRDAHDSARNLIIEELPPYVRILRGWASDPYCMMTGLDASYAGVVLTGYHSAGGRDVNPLAHTLSTDIARITINEEIASELTINAMTAALEQVPVFAVTGDEGICRYVQAVSPGTAVVPVSRGIGRASLSLHPMEAVRRIRETVREAVQYKREDCLFPLPDFFRVCITYREHGDAYKNSFFPGVTQLDTHTLCLETADYREVLRALHFIA